jgi:3-hydroxyacyl-[acyl-carrier-protein] dehydratase
MNNEEIKQRLPHRWPFLLVDRVTKIHKDTIEGYKNVSASDIAFLGHFPQVSILPGVLIVESLAQLSGLLLSNQGTGDDVAQLAEAEHRIGMLTSIRNFKFNRTVEPGDRLSLKSIRKGSSGNVHIFGVAAYVENVEVAVGELQIYLQKRD